MGEMKMGNIVPRVGIGPTSLAFRASMLPLHHAGFLTSLLYPHPPVYAAPCLRGECSAFLAQGEVWLAQCQDIVTKWDIKSGFAVGQHYKITMGAHCHKSVAILI